MTFESRPSEPGFSERGQGRDTASDTAYKPVWESRLLGQSFVRSARTPRTLTDWLETEQRERAERGESVDQEQDSPVHYPEGFELQQQAWKSEFTSALEAAYEEHREDIPPAFWMQFTPTELRMFGGGEMDEVATWVEDALYAQAIEEETLADIEKLADERIAAAERARTGDALLNNANWFAFFGNRPEQQEGIDEDEIRRVAELEVRGRLDEAFEDEISEFIASERKLLEMMRAGVTRPSGQDEKVPDAMREQYGQDPYERFFLSNGDPLSPEDHANFWDSETEFLERLGESTGEEIDITQVTDEELDEILAVREEILRNQIRNSSPNRLDEVLNPWEGPGFVNGAMMEFGEVIDKALQFGGLAIEKGGILTWPARNLTLPALQSIMGTAEERQQETIREIAAETGAPDREKLAEYLNRDANIAFREMEETSPEMYQEYLRMAGLDPTQALAFFQADLLHQNLTPEEQTEYLSDLRLQENEIIEQMQEQDFTLGDEMLHLLGVYGRNIPGRLSTMFTIMLTDQDIQGLATSNQWIDFFKQAAEESEKHGHTPSKALGIDGSVAGLVLDLGSGIAFDPTTWFFGPRLSARGVTQGTKSAAQATAKSALVRRMADDAVDFLQSPSRGSAGVYQISDWLDPVSMGELLNVIDMVPQTLNKTPWRSTKAHHAMEVRTDVLAKLVPDEVRNTIDDVVVRDLGDDILTNGFGEGAKQGEEVIEIVLSRADRKLHIGDGTKRVLAAEGKQISHAPVRLRVTDAPTPGGRGVLVDDLLREGESLAKPPKAPTDRSVDVQRSLVEKAVGKGEDVDRLVFHGTDAASGQEILAFGFEQGGLSRILTRAGDEFATGSDDVIAIFRESDFGKNLPPGEIEQVRTLGSVERATPDELMEQGTGYVQIPEGVKPIGFISRADYEKALKAVDVSPTDVVVRPDSVLPKSLLSGLDPAVRDSVYEIFERAIVQRGAKPSGAHHAAIVRGMGERIRKLIRANAPGRWLGRYTRPGFVGRNMELTGVNAVNKFQDAAYYIWGDDTAKLNQWLDELIVYQREAAKSSMDTAQELAELQARAERLRHAEEALGGTIYDDPVKALRQADEFDEIAAGNRTAADVAEIDRSPEAYNRAREAARAEYEDLGLPPDEFSFPSQDEWINSQMDDAAGLRADADDLEFRSEVTDLNLGDRAAAARWVLEEQKALSRAYKDIDARATGIPETSKLESIYQRMWDDYNRTYIATNPVWKNLVDPETGMVPWHHIGKGKLKPGEGMLEDASRGVSSEMQEAAAQMGYDAEELMQTLFHNQNAQLTAKMPASPLELQMARELGGAAYTRATHYAGISHFRQSVMALYALWRIDKVFTVSTAMTVSFDELLRIFHTVGAKSYTQWMKDRMLTNSARAQALLHGKRPKVRSGAEYLSPKAQERLRAVYEQPNHIRQTERMIDTENSLGWMDIAPNEHGYDDAARQWTAGALQDSGFRAFLRGEDAFKEWFLSPDGERLRRGTVIDGNGESLVVDAADEYYKGWKALFDDVILREARKAGKYDEIRQIWTDIAKRIDESGGRPHDLPHKALEYLGPIRGIRRNVPNKVGVSRLQEGFFDRLFMDPVNYRRGFLADHVRTHESARLRSLYESQGIEIVPDAVIEQQLGLKGLAGSQRVGLREAINDMAVKGGVIPESYLDDLVERSVIEEIDNLLYTFDQSSRMGQQAKALFPFGKPWADMAGFWGREMVRKPVMRGWINKSNAMWLRSANERGLLSFPLVPNRGSAMLSRLAHTDFNIDAGLIGELGTEERPLFGQTFGDPEGVIHSGGLFGAEESDFSPLFFLPTQGVNPFSYMIPGLGILPLPFLDFYMASRYDPVEQPDEYAQLQDQIGQIIPSVHFQQGGPLSRALGGGMAAKMGGMAVDLFGMAGSSNDSFFNLTSEMGDISREIDRTREISALLADPEELEMLLEAETPEEAELLLKGLAEEADKRASGSHLAESALRFMAPMKHTYDASLAEIEDVWLQAAEFEELSYLLDADPERMTAEQRRQAANDIRDQFFQLEPWQRDMMVVEQPSLAVNMVGSWEWTPKGINSDIEGSDYAYRTGGTPVELARHQYMVQRGFVRPVQPIVRARRILGVIDNAKRSAAKTLYEEQLNQVNELLWEVLPEEEKAKLEAVLTLPWAEEWGLESAKEMWFKWRTLEEDLEIWLAEQAGIEPERGESRRKEDLTEFDRLRSKVKLEEDYKPWGVSWTLEEEDIPDKVNEWVVPAVDEKSARIAKALGINLEIGTTGEELFAEAQQIVAQRHHPIYDVVRADYDRYIGDRSVSTGRNKLYEAAQDENVDVEYQDRIHQFLFRHDLIGDREGPVPRQIQDEMRQEFAYIMLGAKNHKTDWEGIWKEQFARRYGPLDWEPPEPESPFTDEGEIKPNVSVPSVRHIVDGDTLWVQPYPGSPRLHSVRLLGLRTEEVNGPNKELAQEQEDELREAILQGVENGDNIYLVRDQRFGDTDYYGRQLAWLWIGDTPYFKPEHLSPTFDPTGGD